jgi:hypothetical protein
MDDFMDTMSIPIDPIAAVAVGVLAWSFLGLWLWLGFEDNEGGPRSIFGFMFTFFCGPSAWIIATWKATHLPPRPRGGPPMKLAQWTRPQDWRN